LTIHDDSCLNRNDYYNDCKNPDKNLTCVIGVQGADGCVIISDTREIIGTENRDVNKIRILWNNKGAMAGAGDGPVISKVAETINRMKNSNSDKIKNIDNNVRTVIEECHPMTLEARIR
jgi:20S proteasome alpha/beta subunit